jgi:hypothetical protein
VRFIKYYLGVEIKEDEMGKNAYKMLVGKPEGKRPLGRPKRRGEDIRMNLREIG